MYSAAGVLQGHCQPYLVLVFLKRGNERELILLKASDKMQQPLWRAKSHWGIRQARLMSPE